MTDEEYFEAFGRLTEEITRLRAEVERLEYEKSEARYRAEKAERLVDELSHKIGIEQCSRFAAERKVTELEHALAKSNPPM